MRTLQINQYSLLFEILPLLLHLYMHFFQMLLLCIGIYIVSHYPPSKKSSAFTPLALITKPKFCHLYQTKF